MVVVVPRVGPKPMDLDEVIKYNELILIRTRKEWLFGIICSFCCCSNRVDCMP